MKGLEYLAKQRFGRFWGFFLGVWGCVCVCAFGAGFVRVPGALVHTLSHSSPESSRAASRDRKDGGVQEGATTEEMWKNAALRREGDSPNVLKDGAGSVSANQT